MKTAVAGYPRIGTLRELKFALEKYFRKEISADELTQTLPRKQKTRSCSGRKNTKNRPVIRH